MAGSMKPWERAWEKQQTPSSGTGGVKPWERAWAGDDRQPIAQPAQQSQKESGSWGDGLMKIPGVSKANDFVIEATNAAVGGLGAAADFVSPGNSISKAIDDFVEYGQGKQSDSAKASRARFNADLQGAETIGEDLAAVGNYLVDAPMQAAAQAIGSFAVPGASIGLARAGAGAAGLGLRGVTRAGRAAGIGAGAALGGGDAAGSAYDLVMEMPERTLLASEQAQALADQGYLPNEIRETLAKEAGRNASILPALAGAAAGAFGAEKVLAGGRLAQGGLRGAIGTGVVEAATEAVEEGVTQFEGRRAAQKIDPSIDPTKNVAAMAAMGAAQGGPVGAAIGGFSHGRAAGDSVQDRYGKIAAERAAEDAEAIAPLALPVPGNQDAFMVDADGRAMTRQDAAARNHPGRAGYEGTDGNVSVSWPAEDDAQPLSLPAPTITVGADGQAKTAGQRTEAAALDELNRWAKDELGYTDDVQAAGRNHPGHPEANPQPIVANEVEPLALPAPTVTVDSSGAARTAEQRSADLAKQREAGNLGLTLDVDAAGRQHPGRPQPIQSQVDEAAHAAQTSPLAGAIEPTEGQKAAGNYRKGHARVAGLDISIENPEGSERRGTDPGGKPWVNRMAGHYGYVRRTEGADGDQVDVFLKPGTDEDYSGPVFVVDQVDPKDGKFDEHKVMVGYSSQQEAEQAYLASYTPGWKGMGKVTPMDVPTFKRWLKGDTTKPAARHNSSAETDLSRQNRDRSRPASIEQMNRIANAPDYDRLGFGRSPNEAAPMVSVAGDTARIPESDMGRTDRVTLGDGTKVPVHYAVIEASEALASHAADGSENQAYYDAPQPGQIRALNNGRMAGLQEAYRRKKAGTYTQAMIEDAQAHGVSSEAIRAKREPVLVRVYGDQENQRPNIGALSNPQSNLGMSATEQAANDARVVPVDLLDLGDTASFDAASNRRFLDAFARAVQQQGEDAAQIRDGHGNYSRQFMDRARAAVFHRAYGDDALTAMASESADPDVRNILNALTMAAPDFAGLEAGPLDIRPQLGQAVHQIRDARSRGLNVEQFLAQSDMFGREPTVDRLVGLLWGNIRAPRRVSEALQDMALFVQNEQARAGNQDMFGGAQVSLDDVINRGEALIRNRYGREQTTTEQTDIFGVGRSKGSGRADANRPGSGQPIGRGRTAVGDAGYAPNSEPAASQVGEPSDNQQDLFGGFDLEPGISRGSGGVKRAAPSRSAGGPSAIRFPSLRSRAAAIVIEPEGGQFAVRVEAKKTLDLRVQDGKITAAGDVASALSSIRKQPQENLMVLLTDDVGMPISVLRHSIGKKAETSVHPDIIIGHAARVPKARHMWLVHNHPSGVSNLSDADLRMSKDIAGLLRGTSVKYQGLMAVGQGAFSNVDAQGSVERGKIPAVLRPKSIPVVERAFVRRGTLDAAIKPQNAAEIAAKVSGGKEGVMLLDVQLHPIAFVPMTAQEMSKLRGTGGLEKLLAGVEKSNASNAVTVVQSEGGVRQAQNLNSALEAAGIRVLDIVAGGKPLAQYGQQMRQSSTFESRQPRSRAGVAVSDAKVFANAFMRKLPGAGRLKVSVVKSVKDIPEGAKPSSMAEGVYYPASEGGRIYLVADNLPTKDRLHQVLAHEVVGHFGVEALLGERFDGVLADVRRLARVQHGERATGNEQPGDKNYATMEAVGMRYPDYGAKARAREVLARMAETNNRKYFLQGLYMKMRAALRAMGFDLKLTNADLRQMVVDAGQFLRRTQADQAYSGAKMAAASMAASEGHSGAWTAGDIATSAVRRPAKTFDGARAAAKLFMGKPLTNSDSGLVAMVSRNSLDKMLSSKAVGKSVNAPIHSRAVANLDQLFDRAVLGWSKADRDSDPNIKAIHRFFAPMLVDGRAHLVKMTVKETAQKDRSNPLYTVEAVDFNEKSPAAQWVGEIANADGIDPRTIRSARDVLSLAQTVESFNAKTPNERSQSEGSLGSPAESKHGTPDAVRSRILAERHARSGGILSKNLGRQEGRLKQPQDDDQAPPDAGLFDGPVESRAATVPEVDQPKQPTAINTARTGETLSKTERLLRDRTLGKIGAFAKPDSIQERLTKLQDNWRAKAVQGVFDHFLSLKALSPTAYMQARLSKGTDGAAEYLVRHGAVKMTDGAIDGAGGRGLAEILSGLRGEHDHFMAWIAGNRAERLLAEGREHLFTPDDVAMLKRLNLGRMQDGRRRVDVYAAALKDLNVLQKSVLDVAQDAGLINREARKLWEHEFYVPFYRIMEGDNTGMMGPGQIAGLVGQRAFKKLKGGKEKLGDLTANTISNWSHLLSASMKNLAAQGAIESAVEMGIAEKIGAAQKDSVRIMVNGKEQHYAVDDPMVLDSLTALHYAGSNDPIMKAMRKMKHALTIGVTISPTFRVRNLLRDSFQAIAIDSDIKLNPVANMIQGWKSTTSESPTMRKLLVGGGAVRFGSFNDGQARNVKRLVDELQVSPGQILSSPADLRRYARKAFDFYQELGDRSETVNRAAIYEAAIKNGKTHLEASYLARDLMDFTSHGSFAAVRLLTQVVPFMNARLQGMYKLGRAVQDNPARFAAVAGAVALASALLYLTMKDDEDYKALPDWARNTYWVARLPGTDKMIYIPKPFEIGALGTVVERGTELAFSGDDYHLRDFAKSMYGVLGDSLALGNFSISDSLPNIPLPQALVPAIEAGLNRDTFRDRNIDSMGQERLPPGDRFTARTSAGAVALGRAINVSPQRLEHMARGYFGWLGTQALNAADYLARPLSNMPENPRRDLGKIDNWFVIGDFVKDAASPSSKYVQRFYDMQNEVNQIYAAYNQARALGDVERADELKRSDDAKLYGIAKAAGNQLTKITQAIRQIERSQLPVKEKRARLDELYQARNRLTMMADERVRAVR